MTRAAVCMEEGKMGCEQGTGAHTNGVQIGNEHRGAGDDCRAIKEALAFNKIEIE